MKIKYIKIDGVGIVKGDLLLSIKKEEDPLTEPGMSRLNLSGRLILSKEIELVNLMASSPSQIYYLSCSENIDFKIRIESDFFICSLSCYKMDGFNFADVTFESIGKIEYFNDSVD